MNTAIEELLSRMRALEDELQNELTRKRLEIEFAIENRRIHFPLKVMSHQRLQRIGVWRFLRESRLQVMLTAPLIYAGCVPFALLDLFVSTYQRLCFPIYGIPRVRRGDYLVFDRSDLPYLNAIEKLNCLYCSYANGVAAYVREVAARTEQYWCPIKHARRLIGSHERYPRFFEFGDAQAFRAGLDRLQKDYVERAGTPPSG